MMPTDSSALVSYGAGGLAAFVGWLIRRQVAAHDIRMKNLEMRTGELERQMATHDAGKEMLDKMYVQLQELTKLTNRIAGHLNIN